MRSLVTFLLLCGCAGQAKTPEQIEYNRQIDLQNWELCMRVYERSGQPTYHFGHSHQHRTTPNQLSDYVKQDLIVNGCKSVLKHYWADHI
jgi:hypothetical protein